MTANPQQRVSEPTGERFIPALMGGGLIEAEHQARYRLALPHVSGLAVLDAGCGVGWGAELLVRAGAREVTGVDIAEEAISDARGRELAATFIVGDLMDLPIEDSSMDVVVCFEALEHASDTRRTLDELVRVLRPDGLLFVSSPNPAVYPAGNPFHIRELPPAELLEAVRSRLPNAQLFRQHLMLSSFLCPDTALAWEPGQIDSTVYSIAAIRAGHDPYSVVVAGNRPLPSVRAVQAIAPSDQLDHLGTLAAALTEERALLHADHERIVAEREVLLERLNQATDLGARVAALTEERELLHADHESIVAEREVLLERLDQATELGARVAALTEERELLHADHARVVAEREVLVERLNQATDLAARVAVERDRFAAQLVSSEQDLARAGAGAAWVGQGVREISSDRVVLEELRRMATRLEAQAELLDYQVSSVSWRLTAPLRRIRGLGVFRDSWSKPGWVKSRWSRLRK